MKSRRDNWRHLATEGWAFILIAVLAFAGGFLIGDLGASPKTETVFVAAPSPEGTPADEGEVAPTAEVAPEGAANDPGAQLFTSVGCGSCHALAAAGTTGETGPNLDEFLAPDDTTEGVEEMIANPNIELAEGYPANVMPQNYSQTLSSPEVHQLAEYLVANTPANPNPESKGGSGSG